MTHATENSVTALTSLNKIVNQNYNKTRKVTNPISLVKSNLSQFKIDSKFLDRSNEFESVLAFKPAMPD